MKNITLSEGEWKIMKLLWSSAPRTIGQIVESLQEDTGWSRTTIFVMLKRLIAKEAVYMDDSGRLQQYYPMIKRKDVAPEETDSFLSRVYDGSIGMSAPRTIGQIVESLQEDTGWSRTTIFVMLKRLIAKEAVHMDDSGRLQQYYPMIKRKDVAPEETDSFLSRVYDGSIGMMVSALVGRKALSQEDIEQLRQILDEAEKGKRG